MKITVITIFTFLCFLSCTSRNRNIIVHHTGALKTLMSGDLSATIDLDSISKKQNLYALGAIDNLKGEVQIFDSKPSNSFVVDSRLKIPII